MKRKVLAYPLFLFLVLPPIPPIDKIVPVEEIVKGVNQVLPKSIPTIGLSQPEKQAYIFADSNYTQATNKFSPGQKIYVRIEDSFRADKEKNLKLLNAAKEEILKIVLDQNGNLFTTSLNAPASPGTYYLDIRIEGEGSSFNAQQNLTIGEGQVSGSVLEPSPQVSVLPSPLLPPPFSDLVTPLEKITFVSKITEFVRNLLASLTGFFK